jgi:RNA polymerase sigma factor (sigma-70 family)
MKMDPNDELIPTRQSLLSRLKDWNDQESWKDFFDTYWRLIYCTAVKEGLSDAEAQDVVQETVISVMKSMPGFRYDPQKGSFKAWLMRLTRWRIIDQKRRRKPDYAREPMANPDDLSEFENLVDPAGPEIEAAWDREWEQNLWEVAVERVKRKVDSKQYQIFDLNVVKRWPVLKISRVLKVNPGRVYLAKHRIGNLITREVAYLRSKPL